MKQDTGYRSQVSGLRSQVAGRRFLGVLFIFIYFCGTGEAFFWGRLSDKKAEEIMTGIRASYQNKDCASALSQFDEFLKEKPSDKLKKEGYKYAGLCYENRNYMDKALGIYKLAVLLYPEDMFFYKRLGEIYLKNGFYENSAELFLAVVEKNGQDYGAALSLARSYRRLGFLSKAKEYYARYVINDDFKDTEAAAEYAAFLLEKNDAGDALFTVNAVLARSVSREFLVLKARCLSYSGLYREASAVMAEAGRLGPLDRDAMTRKVLYSVFSGDYGLEKDLEYFKGDYFQYFITGILEYKKGNYAASAAGFRVSAAKGGEFTREISKNFIERMKNENKILENVGRGK